MSDRSAKSQHVVSTCVPRAVRTPAGDAISLLAFQILRLSADIATASEELSRPAGQTSARWQVLAAADHAPSTVAEIARALGLTRQSVQRVADLLASDKLVRYAKNPEHQRAKLVRLTPMGLAALQSIEHAQVEWANTLARKLNPADVRQASVTLEQIMRLLRL